MLLAAQTQQLLGTSGSVMRGGEKKKRGDGGEVSAGVEKKEGAAEIN